MMSNYSEFETFAKHLSEISSDVLKKYFRTDISIENKEDNTPVTIADKKAEELMREAIIKSYPDHGIVGEEFGTTVGDSEYTWVLDPIDGTKSFVCGAVCFGTLIALLKNGKPILGVINQPILGEFLIGDNQSTHLNERVVSVRNCKSLYDAVLLTTDHLNVVMHYSEENFNSLIRKVKLYRNWGDCYGYYLLATGFADIMIDPIMSFWDIAAVVPIVKGAGGIITDYYGNDPLKGNSIIAATPKLHTEVLRELNLKNILSDKIKLPVMV